MTQVPLKLVVLSLVSEATKRLIDGDTRRSIGNVAQEIGKDIETRPVKSSLGLFIFQCNANIILQHVLDAMRVFKESSTSCKKAQSFQTVRRESTTDNRCSFGNRAVLRSTELESTSSCHETALHQCKRAQSFQTVKEKRTVNVFGSTKLSKEQHSGTADSYHSFGDKQHGKPEDPITVLRFNQRAHMKQKLSGEQHSSTGDSYYLLGATQNKNDDSSSAPQSPQGAVDNKREMFREEQSSSEDTFDSLKVTQQSRGNFSSALQSAQRTRSSRRKLFGEEHSSTAESYYSLGVTQHAQGDFTSAS